jgi:hypothetical protein
MNFFIEHLLCLRISSRAISFRKAQLSVIISGSKYPAPEKSASSRIKHHPRFDGIPYSTARVKNAKSAVISDARDTSSFGTRAFDQGGFTPPR